MPSLHRGKKNHTVCTEPIPLRMLPLSEREIKGANNDHSVFNSLDPDLYWNFYFQVGQTQATRWAPLQKTIKHGHNTEKQPPEGTWEWRKQSLLGSAHWLGRGEMARSHKYVSTVHGLTLGLSAAHTEHTVGRGAHRENLSLFLVWGTGEVKPDDIEHWRKYWSSEVIKTIMRIPKLSYQCLQLTLSMSNVDQTLVTGIKDKSSHLRPDLVPM